MRTALGLAALATLLAVNPARGQEEADASEELTAPGRSGEFTTLPDLVNPRDLEEEISDLERQRRDLERQSREVQELVDRAEQRIDRERTDLSTYDYNLEITHERLAALSLRASAKRARIALYRERLAQVLAPITLAGHRSLGPEELAVVAIARRYGQQVDVLEQDLAALDRDIASLQRYREREHSLISLAQENITTHSARRDRREMTLTEIREEMSSSEARLDGLVGALETLVPSVLLPNATLAEAAEIELPPPGPAPEVSIAEPLEERPAPPEEEPAPPEPPVRTLADLARESSEELQLSQPIEVDLSGIAAGLGDEDVTAEGRGLEIRAPAGAAILAPRRGEVIWAGPLEGYGDVVIVLHGDDSLSVIASVSEPQVHAGEDVEVGMPLALAGELRETGVPGFHFEVRRGGATLDPVEWLGTEDLASVLVGEADSVAEEASPEATP